MHSINNYSPEYINSCRAKVSILLTSYNLVTTAERDDQQLQQAISYLEPVLFNHMVLALEGYFCDRNRTKEVNDGNALNEVTLLCNSIRMNSGKMMEDKTIAYHAEDSVLKLKTGDKIEINESDFAMLSSAFFDEMEKQYA